MEGRRTLDLSEVESGQLSKLSLASNTEMETKKSYISQDIVATTEKRALEP